ncbi:DUF2207 domain-containing protein [Actinomadura kijaniata]|uniref:DUF2207 domain-containing protein n=1 Tax=Actinomadura namibiensis TaxID=182080 RepID=A0A7W3LWH1_ACTNM|nr:DUF2207 domain-containing protein [Actinomadura namibiensis]MBA8955594.1 hypothetical protein [Actinomadura namibiensis]
MSGYAALSGLLRPLTASLAISSVLLPFALATPARAADHAPDRAPSLRAAERVLKDEVALTLGPGGVARVRETVSYDFSGGSGSLERTFVTRRHESITRDRVFRLENVRASSPDGGPTKVTVGGEQDTRTTVTVSGGATSGRHTVVLEYDVRGAVAPVGSGEELQWPAAGGWQVPVDEARVTVNAGTAIRSVNCFAGPLESAVGCTQFSMGHVRTQGLFVQQQLLPEEYLTVVAGLPPASTGGKPITERRHTVATAFSVNGITVGALLGLVLLLLGGFVGIYLLRGRDARVVGKKAAEGDHAPVAGDHFEPPDGVRPGQIGTLIDEQADVIDVTATIVDLAVRGHLLIDEEDRNVTGRLDWTLVRLDRPAGNDDLLTYERLLLEALFTAPDGAPRPSVKLSELGGTFATQLARVRSAMYDDVVEQGWFARRPDTVRSRWTVLGLVLTGLGVLGTVALALTTDLALAGLAVIIAGAAMAYAGQYMPAKTARGSTVLAHTIGFRAFLERGEVSGGELPSQQRIALFSRFLPYAVVFGVVPKWAEVVKDAGERAEGADNLYWYEGPAEWDLSNFAESMRTFTLATSGAISQSRGL